MLSASNNFELREKIDENGNVVVERVRVKQKVACAQEKEEPLLIVDVPPPLPEAEDLQTAQQSPAPDWLKKSQAKLTRLSDVQPEPVRWLWRGRIPLGKITILDGDPDLGKSLISADLAARTSTARPMPDGTASDLSEVAGVVLLSAEDDPADTIRPRLDAAGADCSRVGILRAIQALGSERLPTLRDLDAIREAIKEVSAKLLVIDPLMAYLPGKTDSHRDQDIRSALAPLAALAAETGVAVVVIRHLNKANGGNPLYRGGGSIGIIGAARSGLLVAKDPEDEDRRILAVSKSNLAKIAPALAYRLVVNANDVPSVVWEGATVHTAATLLAQQNGSDEDRSVLAETKEFLCKTLADGPREAKEVQREAHNVGISEATLRRAKTSLRVIARKGGNFLSTAQRWMWSLPHSEGAHSFAEGAHVHVFEHLQANTEKKTRNYANLSEDAQDSAFEHLQGANEHLQGENWEPVPESETLKFFDDTREPRDAEVV